MALSGLLAIGLVLVPSALAALPLASIQALSDSLSRDQCVQLYRQLSGDSDSVDKACLPLLRRWNRKEGDASALRDALRDLGEPRLADAIARGQDKQGAVAISDSLKEVQKEAATEAAEAAEEELGDGSDDSNSRPAGKDRPAEKDGFGAAGVTLLLTLLFLLLAAMCFCAGRAVCPNLAQYDPSARRRRRDSVSSRVNQMLRSQRLRGKMAMVTAVTGLRSGGGGGGGDSSDYAPVITDDQLSVSTMPASEPQTVHEERV